MGFDGGELRRARVGRKFSAAAESGQCVDDTEARCAYCGAALTGAGYSRMPDGRLRCTLCSDSVVKTAGELQQIYDRVTTYMESFFGAVTSVPVDIQFLDERKLKKKLKHAIGEVDDGSILILGVAVSDKKGYHLYLENGAPRMSVIATVVHELTHIWQYVHWKNADFAHSLKGRRRLVVYEGMAKWVEIQYLYLVGEIAVARREETATRARQDEYGQGFRMYADQYPISHDVMMNTDTPFVEDRCPIQ